MGWGLLWIAQVVPVVLSQSMSLLGLPSPAPRVTAHQYSQGISSGLQPDSCKFLNDSQRRGVSWMNCPSSSKLSSAPVLSAAVPGCSKVLQAGAVESICRNAMYTHCGSPVTCSQPRRTDVCSKNTFCFMELDFLFKVGSEVQPNALGGKIVYSTSLSVPEVALSSYQKAWPNSK